MRTVRPSTCLGEFMVRWLAHGVARRERDARRVTLCGRADLERAFDQHEPITWGPLVLDFPEATHHSGALTEYVRPTVPAMA